MDVSKNKELVGLYCYSNQLTNIDVAQLPKLQLLSCGENKLTSLDVSKNKELLQLYCNGNQLTDLDVSKNTNLTTLVCHFNKIAGDAMSRLVNSLPDVNGKELATDATDAEKEVFRIFVLVDHVRIGEGNQYSKEDLRIAIQKGWKPYDRNGKWDERIPLQP